jgi:virginiamycin A acetyltransferase
MRSSLKAVAQTISLILILPIWLAYIVARLACGNSAFYGFSQGLALLPGITGNTLRYAFYRLTLARLGKDVCICFMATLSHPDTEIGDHAYIGPFCNIGLCRIGDDCLLGSGVHVMSGFGQHGSDDLTRPMRLQAGKLVQVQIGADCWIGNQSIIGADIGSKCIIGAASLVTKAIPDFAIAYGSPAKPVRDRRDRAV